MVSRPTARPARLQSSPPVSPSPVQETGRLDGSLALDTLTRTEQLFPGPRDNPVTPEMEGHRWPQATGRGPSYACQRRPAVALGLVK